MKDEKELNKLDRLIALISADPTIRDATLAVLNLPKVDFGVQVEMLCARYDIRIMSNDKMKTMFNVWKYIRVLTERISIHYTSTKLYQSFYL